MDKIILIGNYPPDKQESMERFALMLYSGYREVGLEAEIWRPTTVLLRPKWIANCRLAKWLGYVDKWILFPQEIKSKLKRQSYRGGNVRFHICDHSNAPYLRYLPLEQTIITCHDVLAIRGALGYADAYCTASRTGKILQDWILKSLCQAKYIACVSAFTLKQLLELCPGRSQAAEWIVIHNAFNADFNPGSEERNEELVEKAGIPKGMSYLFTVGSNLARKNRKMLIDMCRELGSRWTGKICFAGQPPNDALVAYAKTYGLTDRIISVVKPDHETLMALYNQADAFVFPSYSEGFGWPLIEAQACLAPVIASNIPPLMEISGGAAFHLDPDNPKDFAEAFLALQNIDIHNNIVEKGQANVPRFGKKLMMKQYLELLQLSSFNSSIHVS